MPMVPSVFAEGSNVRHMELNPQFWGGPRLYGISVWDRKSHSHFTGGFVRRNPERKNQWQWSPPIGEGQESSFLKWQGAFRTRRAAADAAIRAVVDQEIVDQLDPPLKMRPVPHSSGEGAIYTPEYLHKKYAGYNNPRDPYRKGS